jgi:hypothetical protein
MVFPKIKRLHAYFSILRSACAVPSAEVFCSSLYLRFRGVLLRYLLNCFDLNTFDPVVAGMLLLLLLLLLKLLISRYWIELNYRHIHEQIFSLNHSFLLIIILFVLFVTWSVLIMSFLSFRLRTVIECCVQYFPLSSNRRYGFCASTLITNNNNNYYNYNRRDWDHFKVI